MSKTFAQVLTDVRYNLSEDADDAKIWTDPELYSRINTALLKLSKLASKQLGDHYYIENTLTPVASATSMALPNGTLYSNAEDCNGNVSRVFVDEVKMDHAKDLWRGCIPTSGSKPTQYMIRGNKIYFDGYVDTNSEVILHYYYRPEQYVSTSSVVVDFPEDHIDVLVLRTTVNALLKDNSDNVNDFRAQLGFSYKEMLNDIGSSRSTESRQAESYDGESY